MLESNSLSPRLWDEYINCAYYINNIFQHKTLKGINPFEYWSGHNPDVSHFIFFGSKAWDRIPAEERRALQTQIQT